jgi:hypothetical protein
VQGGLVEWLDGRAPRSVAYVNCGSITVMTNEQLLEFAWGLAGSGYAFVWNIRPDLLKGGTAVLPPELLAAVEGRALLTTWCLQEAALAHEALGVFLTHAGWNSTLESICAGVPMLSWPFFAEQQTNCRYKRTEWGVGMEIGVTRSPRSSRRPWKGRRGQRCAGGGQPRQAHQRRATRQEEEESPSGQRLTVQQIVCWGWCMV